ncbi:hypothetical protein BDP67DRAFT_490633 [Colletotrichum lupini]|nr:hypothetical protein BDP67DRAFT_490633 [Colletotrichum lupini]
MQANEEPSQAMSPNAHLQQRVPMISSDQCPPDNTPEGPDEGPQPTSASAERLDEAKRATETLKPTWKIWALEIACIVLSTLLIGAEKFEDGRMTETPILADRILPNSSVWKVSLPGGFNFDHQSKAALFTDILNGNHTFAFQHNPALLRARIASFFLIYTAPMLTESDKTWWMSTYKGPKRTWQEALDHVHSIKHEAVEVLFHLCVQSYNTTVQLGRERTLIEDTFTEPVGQDGQAFLDMDCQSLVLNRSWACSTSPDRGDEILSLRDPAQRVGSATKLVRNEAAVFSTNYRAMEEISQAMRSFFAGFAFVSMAPDTSGSLPQHVQGFQFISTLHEAVLFSRSNILNLELRELCLKNIYENVATLVSASYVQT